MRASLLILLLLPPLLSAAEVYRWRDAQGVWHYGDQAPPGAEKVEVRPPQTYTPAPPPKPAPAAQPPAEQPAPTPRIAIATPAPNATLRDAEGRMEVVVEVQPRLSEGQRIQLLLDGARVGEPRTDPNFTLAGVERGAHVVSAQVVDQAGKVLATTPDVPFFMHQPSRLHPRPQPPARPTPR